MKRIGVTQSLMTLANAGCGFVAITVLLGSASAGAGQISDGAFQLVGGLILLGMLFDTLDGKIARLTNQESDFGAQLDSLSDVVTFGVTPALLAKAMIDQAPGLAAFGAGDVPLGLLLCMLFVMCAILRLARFSAEQTDEETGGHGFFGLPTPAAAGVIAALALLYVDLGAPYALIAGLPYALPVLSLLMVSRIPYSHIGTMLLRGRRPFPHLLRIVFFGFLAAFLLVESVFAGFLLYLSSGPARLVWNLVYQRDTVEEEPLF